MKSDDKDSPKVKFVLLRSHLPRQFGRGLLFVQDARKRSLSAQKLFGWMSILSPVLAAMLLLRPNNRTSKLGPTGVGIRAVGDLPTGQPIEIPRLADGTQLTS